MNTLTVTWVDGTEPAVIAVGPDITVSNVVEHIRSIAGRDAAIVRVSPCEWASVSPDGPTRNRWFILAQPPLP